MIFPILPSWIGTILLLVSTIPPCLRGSGCPKELKTLFLGLQQAVMVMVIVMSLMVVKHVSREVKHALHVNAAAAVSILRQPQKVPRETVVTLQSRHVLRQLHHRVELTRHPKLAPAESSHVTHHGRLLFIPDTSSSSRKRRIWARDGSGTDGCSLLKECSG